MTKHLVADTIEPKFATPDRSSKLDPFGEKLSSWLKTEAGKSRKQRRTVTQLHGDLAMLGFTGPHARVAAFAGPDDGFTAEIVMPHLRYWLQEAEKHGTIGLRAVQMLP